MRFRTSPNLPVNNLEGNSQAYPTLGCYLIIIINIIIMCNIHTDSAYYVNRQRTINGSYWGPNKMDLDSHWI